MVSINDELTALRVIFNQDQEYYEATPKQIKAMNVLLNRALNNYKNRIEVIKLITGLENLTSSKQLTMHTVSTLISLLKTRDPISNEDKDQWEVSEYGKELISTCEKFIEKQPRGHKDGVGNIWYETSLPNMFETNT